MNEEIRQQAAVMTRELCEKAALSKGKILVVGCSSSEVCGDLIGSNSNLEIAEAVFAGIYEVTQEKGIYLAAQCCEHLNRALVVEKETAEKYFYPCVNAVPFVKAGGSFATAAYGGFENPCVVEKISAKAGIDIGETLIGMHIAPVCVPLRISVKKIGEANVICARSRLKFIGGVRAHYDENLM